MIQSVKSCECSLRIMTRLYAKNHKLILRHNNNFGKYNLFPFTEY